MSRSADHGSEHSTGRVVPRKAGPRHTRSAVYNDRLYVIINSVTHHVASVCCCRVDRMHAVYIIILFLHVAQLTCTKSNGITELTLTH